MPAILDSCGFVVPWWSQNDAKWINNIAGKPCVDLQQVDCQVPLEQLKDHLSTHGCQIGSREVWVKADYLTFGNIAHMCC